MQELEEELATSAWADAVSVVRAELDHIAEEYGTIFVAVYAYDGTQLAGTGVDAAEPNAAEVREVADTQRAQYHLDGGETRGDDLFHFLLPVHSPRGPLVPEIAQREDVVGDLLCDLRLLEATRLGAMLLFAVPLAYLLGGRRLNQQQRAAEVTADTDELTGLLGRRPFRPMLQAALDDPSNSSVALALVDVDEFKRVNDRLGHAHGDRVLVALAESIGAVRAGDRAFRLGGDEFAVVLPNAAEHRAAEIVQRVRDAMTELMPGVTFSCGVAASAGGAAAIPLQVLWERADAALYVSKHDGRDRTTLYSSVSAGRPNADERRGEPHNDTHDG